MGEFGPWHLLIVAFVFVLLFGSKKLPDAARSVGRSMRIFKAEMQGLHEDDAHPRPEIPGREPATNPPPSPAPAPSSAAPTDGERP